MTDAELEAARAERAAPAPDPFAVASREVAVALWSVADAAKKFFGLEAQAQRTRRRDHKELAAQAFLELGRDLDVLGAYVEHERGR